MLTAIAPRAMPAQHAPPDTTALVRLETRWLASHDSATFDTILADDFRHPVPQGVILTKREQIAWAVAHVPPPDSRRTLRDLHVRIYGTTAIVNGAVCAANPAGAPTRSLFTDVFVWRNRRWQAVNAQENIAATSAGC